MLVCRFFFLGFPFDTGPHLYLTTVSAWSDVCSDDGQFQNVCCTVFTATLVTFCYENR